VTICIIIPAFNAGHWLPRSIESALSQTRPADEIIVVDDGSTDDTAAVCHRYGAQIQFIQRENGGLSAARNTGLAASHSEWFLSLDADDIVFPDALAALAETAAQSDAGVVYGFVLQRREKPVETRLHSLPYAVGKPPDPARTLFWWTAISTAGSALVRRSVNDAIGGVDENFRQVEDCEYWLRCAVTTSFAHCDRMVLDKTFHRSSLGQQTDGSIWFRLQLQLKFLLWCKHRGIDTSFLAVQEAALIDHALTRIYREQAWAALSPVLRQARRLGVRSAWYGRALLREAFMRLTHHLPPESPRCQEVYKNWLNNIPS